MNTQRGLLAALLGSTLFLAGCPVPPLIVLPTELPKGVQLRSYSEQLSVEEGSAARWTITDGALPAGVSLDEENGSLSGVPTGFGTFTFSVQVTDAQFVPRVGEQAFSIEVIQRLSVDSTLSTAQVGVAYSEAVSLEGGVAPFTFALVGLPAGLEFDTSSGVISGTPVNADPSVGLQVTVTDSGNPQQQRVANLTLVVRPQPLVFVTEATLPEGMVGTAYSATIETMDGRTPVSFAVSDGLLPAGLRLDTDSGEISGTPTDAGTSTFTIQAEDSDDPANVITQEFTLTITA